MPTQHLDKYWQTLSKHIKQLSIDETLKLKICSDPTLDEADMQYEVYTKKELKAEGENAEKMNRQFGQHQFNKVAYNQCMGFPAKETKEMPSKIEKTLPETCMP
uniref:Uncharacterized protein n=1 Tax=Rhabditophanes sp. KR3021 TaxID=114890 RepID=A0AC35TZW0_9BILA